MLRREEGSRRLGSVRARPSPRRRAARSSDRRGRQGRCSWGPATEGWGRRGRPWTGSSRIGPTRRPPRRGASVRRSRGRQPPIDSRSSVSLFPEGKARVEFGREGGGGRAVLAETPGDGPSSGHLPLPRRNEVRPLKPPNGGSGRLTSRSELPANRASSIGWWGWRRVEILQSGSRRIFLIRAELGSDGRRLPVQRGARPLEQRAGYPVSRRLPALSTGGRFCARLWPPGGHPSCGSNELRISLRRVHPTVPRSPSGRDPGPLREPARPSRSRPPSARWACFCSCPR
jgi:hypothetical protein